ncbi:MAG: hypothetical protein J6D27_05190 [Ruminiclostridium sp.]|nr:hypothetical protein [Ruminiclostridium sp.]
MSGEILVFFIMSVIFLVIITLIEVCKEDNTKEEAPAENKAEAVYQNQFYHSCDYNYTAEELKKVG